MRKPSTATSTSVPAPGEGKRGEESHLGYILGQAAAAHRRRMERALAGTGVTAPQFAVLTMLDAYPGLSNADLARLSLLTPQTLSVIVANLERAGAIVRRPHAVHGRILQIELTEGGRGLLARCRERAHAVDRQLGKGLSADEERVVRRWLVAIAVREGACS